MRRNTEKKGFTILEVMLFLAITGLMLIGVIGGTYSAIASQRYTDSVRSFAEFLRQTYAEVISPETLKEQGGNDNTLAIYGKAIVFGLDGDNSDNKSQHIYTATLVGRSSTKVDNFVKSLSENGSGGKEGVNLQFYCGEVDSSGNEVQASTVTSYLPPWEAKIYAPAATEGGTKPTFKGTVFIVRSPKSGVVRTVYYGGSSDNIEGTFDIKEHCKPGDSSANTSLRDELNNHSASFVPETVNFCIKADQSSLQAPMRNVRLAEDGRNTSAVSIINMDDDDELGSSKCK